ncbi:MAG: bifunctional glutamate N-acetyltransferase/amino-acid acetyltransferase ArgJ [Bacteroides sp.]|nr:bifunctional glutamate N-acetyltransferase/amino-acid acetyltransferase ArgJ [Prevotella sp.]MCM1407470.1 bifunctional glutamate N-acetyltransferase/amino-acid acetyltransferase ArgJ [Treponema brennaborense]MCM1469960.1 bifunctional glutamate N-acetyltransferase/amino-acid acetyltransferase ArgJ [Bacteroides sp.]
MQFIDGGVTAPKGFLANGVLCGIKAGRTQEDTALIVSEKMCAAAGMFTRNSVRAEPVKLTALRLSRRRAQAVIVNSGNANACTGEQGARNAVRMARAAAAALTDADFSGTAGFFGKIDEDDVLVCSTGVIGQQLPVEKIEAHISELTAGLSKEGHEKARAAIMTTDTKYKEFAVETEIGGKKVRLGAMAKGSGMIHINLGTMLGFITTDCAISADMLNSLLRKSAAGTYNCVSIDGDTSTNDTLLILANGMAGNAEITESGADCDAFFDALNALNTKMARAIAADGEGAGRLIECVVSGAETTDAARVLAKSVISSNLVKAAMFGKDANWGRILCALGYSGVPFTIEKTSVSFAACGGFENGGSAQRNVKVYDHGVPLDFDEECAKNILSENEVKILVEMEDGAASGTAWGCDLTYNYVRINGDYRT